MTWFGKILTANGVLNVLEMSSRVRLLAGEIRTVLNTTTTILKTYRHTRDIFLIMPCKRKPPPLIEIDNNINTAIDAPALSLFEYLLPNLAPQPLHEPPPNFDRPSTPLGFCDYSEPACTETTLEATCTRLVSEAWAVISTESECETPPHIICPAPRAELLPSLTTEQHISEPQNHASHRQRRSRYHGHSKSALADYKVFWNSRYDEWCRWQVELERWEALAYDGIQRTTSPPRRDVPKLPETNGCGRYQGQYVPDIGAPIYPRTGDLASLRRPAALERERWFASFPLHKIHKILYAYDMDYRSELTAGVDAQQHMAEEDDIADISFASDEGTLVEEPHILDKLKEEALLLHGGRYQEAGAWEVDWDVKWELLLALIRRHDEDLGDGDLSDVCRAYLDGGGLEDDEDDCIIYTGFDELVIC